MENNKGFTLVELLAIIIILAIIATITIPNVINSLESAQKEVAKESAYGYKRSVSKYYYQEVMNKANITLNGIYQVKSDGSLYNNNSNHQITLDGTPPTEGALEYNDGELKSGCLTINNYKITFIDGEVKDIEKGSCNNQDAQIFIGCNSENFNPSPESWFNIDKKSGKITGFTEEWDGTTDITIPCSINGVTTTEILPYAFDNEGLTSVVIPGTITRIHTDAFATNQINNITFNYGIQNISGFNNNYLTSIELPASVKTIGNRAFKNNQLTDIHIPGNIKTIGDQSFEENQISRVVLDNGVQTINGFAFSNNNINTLVLADSISSIGYYSFYDNNLTTVYIPSKVTTIEYWAFAKNDISDLIIPTNVTSIGAAAFNDNQLEDDKAYIYKRNNDGTEDKTSIISYGGKNKNITLPNNIITIESDAFQNTKLESIILSTNVISIENSSFSNNYLTSIEMPNSVTSIGNNAFSRNNLTTAKISENTTSIGSYAFYKNHLQDIIIPEKTISIGTAAFNDNQLEDDKAYIYKRNNDGTEDKTNVISYGGKNKNITLPNNITNISEYAFSSNNLESVILPTNLENIDKYSFKTNNLTSITIPETVKNIETNAFAYNNLTTATIQGNINNIYALSFYKTASSNPNLTTIYNNTGNIYNWNSIINGSSGDMFEFGTVTSEFGDVTITKN